MATILAYPCEYSCLLGMRRYRQAINNNMCDYSLALWIPTKSSVSTIDKHSVICYFKYPLSQTDLGNLFLILIIHIYLVLAQQRVPPAYPYWFVTGEL